MPETPSPWGERHGPTPAEVREGLAARDEEVERLRATIDRIRVWADGPCPTRPRGVEITGDRAFGYVQAMDEIAQFLAGHGPLAATPPTTCVHPEGYEGECPCPPTCICCQPTIRCSAAILCQAHVSHSWQPQPGMDPVLCPGPEQSTEEATP